MCRTSNMGSTQQVWSNHCCYWMSNLLAAEIDALAFQVSSYSADRFFTIWATSADRFFTIWATREAHQYGTIPQRH